MKSFETTYLHTLPLSHRLLTTIRQIGEYKGKQQLYQQQAPEVLENLRNVAIIQSTESSNRLEGITATFKRIKEIVEEKTIPANRSEGEIAGYRDVLTTIHMNYDHIPFTEGVGYREFEKRLGKLSSGHGSKTGMVLNAIDAIIGDFTIADVEKACPMVGRDWIRTLLQRLKNEGKVVALGKGRYARWRKV